ncbi:MAG: hypothetical protein MJ093_07230, partial [Saccharofermentans sp.]|nr:hypothetical protein [Saccharofermentans sp.]
SVDLHYPNCSATELVDLMMKDTGITSTSMKVDGGVCACEFLMQLQSDLLGVNITRAKSDEMTAMGVGLLAGLETGFYESLEAVSKLYEGHKTYVPVRTPSEATKLMNDYRNAVKAASVYVGKEA